MAKVLVTESNLTDIGDAIRDRLQVGTQYLPSEMGDAVRSIRVIDIDTTLTRSGYAADAKVVGDKFDALVDTTLLVSGKAADAKVTGNKIRATQKSVEDIESVTGVTLIDNLVEGKYIQTNGNIGTTVAINSPQNSENFAYAIVPCVVGDKITLNATGGNAGRLWAFLDSSNALLSKADVNAEASDLVLTAPANTAKIVVNFYLLEEIGANYIGTSVDSRIANNSELIDIRVGANGTTYPTAGDAVRGQIEELNTTSEDNANMLTATRENANASPALRWVQGSISGTGQDTSSSIRIKTNYVTCAGSEFVVAAITSGFWYEIVFYSNASEGGYVSGTGWLSEDYRIAIPSNIKYFRVILCHNNNADISPSDGGNITIKTRCKLQDIIKHTRPAFEVSNYLDGYKTGYYWQTAEKKTTVANARAYDKFIVPAGLYYYRHLYAYFCWYSYLDGSDSGRFTSDTFASFDGTITLAKDAVICITTNTASTEANGKWFFTDSEYIYNNRIYQESGIPVVKRDSLPDKNIIITVKKDSSGMFTRLIDAVNYISDNYNQLYTYEIHMYSGTYDILEEMGGAEFISGITSTSSTRSGMTILPNTKIIGHGTVVLSYLPDDSISTYYSTERVAVLEVYGNFEIENINIVAKNCRYCVHDEAGNASQYANAEHVYKNCFFEHKGNFAGGWVSCDTIGQGSASGNHYTYKDCVFKSASFYAFGCHNNANQDTNILSFDGCVFDGDWNGYALRFGYHGANTKKSYIFFKNCIANNPAKISSESSGSDNIYELCNFTNIEFTVE